jgi:proteasome assembly chaperone (PAC2) family protein
MGIKLYKEPELTTPDLLVGWPGIGNVGIVTVDAIREQLNAEEFGEIEAYDFFYPKGVTIKSDLLEKLDFPSSKFYYQRLGNKDLIIFIGEEQPANGGHIYAEGRKAYQMANLVLDVAENFGCQRVYTSGAAVAMVHHTLKPRVWIAPNKDELINELKRYENTILMSEVEGRSGQGNITGLNGLLLGVARKRGLAGACLMGEIPDYLSGAPFPYPRASMSVLEVIGSIIGFSFDVNNLNNMNDRVSDIIDGIYEQLPDEIRERLEQRKVIAALPGAITEEDQKWLKEHIDELFKHESDKDERPI